MNKGFTLVELLITITIIAVLSGIGLVVYSNVQAQARDSKRRSDILEIQKALEIYYSSQSFYPGSLNELSNNTYFSNGQVPKDPKGADYIYADNTTWCLSQPAGSPPIKYVLCTSELENKTAGNRWTLPGDGCSPVEETNGTNPLKYYCVGSP
ncbi:prepilin-type N-terminal cleavage/methylation domain-containing protein [Candidatus Daviesbacteria bacterium]|nr:prepilin-type N-terminal cleavage/methylation domain-containing protein [Candidatus Daviesbacteria bacterium]